VFITEVEQVKRVPKQRRKGEIKVEKYKTVEEQGRKVRKS
jgi:hypothetical protein